jgi:hypothetical protein
MPGVGCASSRQQALEVLVGAASAEDVANLVDIVRQDLAGEASMRG